MAASRAVRAGVALCRTLAPAAAASSAWSATAAAAAVVAVAAGATSVVSADSSAPPTGEAGAVASTGTSPISSAMVASGSALKVKAVAGAFGISKGAVTPISTTAALSAPEQPLGDLTEKLAGRRLEYALELQRVTEGALGGSGSQEDRVVAIESGLYGLGGPHPRDVAVVKVAAPGGRVFTGYGTVPIDPTAQVGSTGVTLGSLLPHVTPDLTLGQLVHDCDPSIPANNWMGPVLGKGREEQIGAALASAERKRRLYSSMGLHPDFPKPPVMFQDIGDIFVDPLLLNDLVDAMVSDVTAVHREATKLVMLESRGFHLAGALQQALRGVGHHVSIVQARKPKKLPGQLHTVHYGKEYGADSLSVQTSMFARGDKVLVVDDIIATGGTLGGAEQLVQAVNAAGGDVTLLGHIVVNQVDFFVPKWVVKTAPTITLR